MAVLSVDLAYKDFRDIGAVTLGWHPDHIHIEVVHIPLQGEPSTRQLAGFLNDYCQKHQVRILLVDGPQGWKAAGSNLEHARRCEQALNTPAKTGLPESVKPAGYGDFVRFSIRLFDDLVGLGWERLPGVGKGFVPGTRYIVETFPLSAWRALGIPPLPAKKKAKPKDLDARLTALTSLLPLNVSSQLNHDALQAVVGGLAGLAIERENWGLIETAGDPPFFQDGYWREGFIVNATRSVAQSHTRSVSIESPPSQSVSGATAIGNSFSMAREQALHFRDALRDARAVALADAEAFDELLFAIERLGRYIHGQHGNLGIYRAGLQRLAAASPLAETLPKLLPEWHSTFESLLRQLREARNSALHEGAFARHLASHAIAVALILEDALMNGSDQIGDFMTRTPVCALLWQPISFVRQTMLARSFSFLPLNVGGDGTPDWRLISDAAVAGFLRNASEPKRALGLTLQEAMANSGLRSATPFVCSPGTSVREALDCCRDLPVLIVASQDPATLLGIAAPFDLL